MKKIASILVVLVVIAVAIWYFVFRPSMSSSEAQVAGSAQMQSMPPLPVPMLTLAKQTVGVWQTYPAKVSAINYAEVRPQVSGEITQVKFKAGTKVNKGQVLMVIDTKSLTDQVNVAKADLKVAEASLALAENDFQRAQRLIGSKAISQKVFDQTEAQYNQAKSSIELAKARVNQAQTTLNYAYVRAPFTGVVSRAEVTKGNVVQAGPSAPVLFSILSDDGVYIDFDVDEQTYLQHMSAGKVEDLKMNVTVPATQSVIEGEFISYDNASNGSSGTIRARGAIKDKSAGLLPGMSVRASISQGQKVMHLVIPETAIGVDQNRRFVWMVDENNVVQYRPVQLGSSVEGGIIVLSGLNEGETIVVDGLIKIRPNTVVMDITKMPPPVDNQPAQ